MKRDDFLRKLELLLADISAVEREEALAFYRDYFEDAGEGNEAAILEELGSPESVAEIIKRDLGMVAVTEFSNGAYEEEHSAGRNQEENGTGESKESGSSTYYSWTENQNENPYGTYREKKTDTWKIVLIVILVLAASPMWMGVLSGIIGTVFGLSAALIAVTTALFVAGLVLAGLGIAMMAGIGAISVSIPAGLAFIGCGLLILALAMLFLLACVAVFGMLLPWACKGIYGFCKKLFVKKEAQAL